MTQQPAPTPMVDELLKAVNPREWQLLCRKPIWWDCITTPSDADSIPGENCPVVDRESYDRVCRMLAAAVEQRNQATFAHPIELSQHMINRGNETLLKLAKGEA